jgi:hypothetical protein
VHTRIGAAAAVDPHGAAEYRPEAAFDDILHGVAIRLALPATEIPAVVGTDTFPALDF